MEYILNLFDKLWFELQILTLKPQILNLSPENDTHIQPEPPVLKISHLRSFSDDHFLTSKLNLDSEFDSPNSVLHLTPKLQTILSGKEIAGEFAAPERQEEDDEEKTAVRKLKVRRGRRNNKRRSKSLTELEFEEVKGFMDLGFVFSEEDHKDEDLVSMIPGLQKLGFNGDKVVAEVEHNLVARPYLSEAWRMKEAVKKPMKVNLRVENVLSEMEMKNQIKVWAHSVASAVR